MKKALIGLLVVLLLPLLVALAFLLPAHWQIRDVQPELPDFVALTAALAVPEGPVALHYVNTASQRGPLGTLGHPGILVDWPDGRRFLIDTGMPPTQAVEFGRPIELLLEAEPTQTFGGIDAQLGAAVDSIRGVAFTHLHSDHTDGLPDICAAQAAPAIVFQAPLQYRERNYTTDMGFEALARASCSRRELDAATIMAIPGFPGLVAVSLGGHTPGSTLYALRVDGHYWLFSGDITNDKRSVLEDLPKPWVYSALIVPEDTRRTAQLRGWLQELDDREDVTVLPAHDVGAMAAVLPSYGTQ